MSQNSEKIMLSGSPKVSFLIEKENNIIVLSYSINNSDYEILREINSFSNESIIPSIQLYANTSKDIEESLSVTYTEFEIM